MHHHHDMFMLSGPLAFFIFGFATSLHCVGMCGPLSCLFCQSHKQKFLPLFLYHLGRLLIYSFLGFTAARLNLTQYPWMGHPVAVLTTILILAILGSYLPLPINNFMLQATNVSKKHPYAGAFSLGVLTPMLPCGMLYAAVGASAMAASPFEGFYWMGLFALGTMPLLLLGQLGYHFIEKFLSPTFRKGLQWVLMGVSLTLFLVMRH